MKGRCFICGIAGFIGESTHPEITYQLITSVFEELEIRGTDAAGFWGSQKGKSGKIIYHKDSDKASDLIKREIWKKVCPFNPNLLLVHARASSIGVGTAWQNKNNHPFVSADRNIALVHNGRIQDVEYKTLKKKYEVFSNTDSEIFLRIFEAGEMLDDGMTDLAKDDKHHRLLGIRNIWSQITKGHMACAIGERMENGARRLWLFRNKHRPIWLFDLRKTLGQIFFCSTPEIWQRAVNNCPEAKAVVRKKTKFIELPEDEIWVMTVTLQYPTLEPDNFKKYSVHAAGFSTYEHKGNEIPIKKGDPSAEVVTNLNDKEEVVGKNNYGCGYNAASPVKFSHEVAFDDINDEGKSGEIIDVHEPGSEDLNDDDETQNVASEEDMKVLRRELSILSQHVEQAEEIANDSNIVLSISGTEIEELTDNVRDANLSFECWLKASAGR